MRLVVADTGPLNYLILIEAVDLLLVPDAVSAELSHADAPALIRAFAAAKPTWLEVHPDLHRTLRMRPIQPWTTVKGRNRALPMSIGAGLVSMDDRAGICGRTSARLIGDQDRRRLDLAARRGRIDLAAALTRLKATIFRYRPEILDTVLAPHRRTR